MKFCNAVTPPETKTIGLLLKRHWRQLQSVKLNLYTKEVSKRRRKPWKTQYHRIICLLIKIDWRNWQQIKEKRVWYHCRQFWKTYKDWMRTSKIKVVNWSIVHHLPYSKRLDKIEIKIITKIYENLLVISQLILSIYLLTDHRPIKKNLNQEANYLQQFLAKKPNTTQDLFKRNRQQISIHNIIIQSRSKQSIKINLIQMFKL